MRVCATIATDRGKEKHPPGPQGVRRVAHNTLVIGIRHAAKPGEQFLIRRKADQRRIQAVNANGVVRLSGAKSDFGLEKCSDESPIMPTLTVRPAAMGR